MGAAGLFFLLLTLALIGGTGCVLASLSLPPSLLERAWLVVGSAFFLGALFGGYFMRRSQVPGSGRALILLIVASVQIVYLRWLVPLALVEVPDYGWGPLPGFLATIWVAAGFLGSLVLGMTRPGRPQIPPEYEPTGTDAKKFIDEHDLWVPEEELEALAASPKGLVCKICKIPYTGMEEEDPSWQERWVRCPRVADHIFHARDFERAEWRCPIDKCLLYHPPGR